jgi:hypothetical protein
LKTEAGREYLMQTYIIKKEMWNEPQFVLLSWLQTGWPIRDSGVYDTKKRNL